MKFGFRTGRHVPTCSHCAAAHVLAIFGPFRRICIFNTATKQFVFKADDMIVLIALDYTIKNTFSKLSDFERRMRTYRHVRVSRYLHRKLTTRESQAGNSDLQRCKEVTFQANVSIYLL